MGNSIAMIIVFILGLGLFLWGFKEIRKKSIGVNILDAIIDYITGLFIFSELGVMLFGLLLMILSLLEILGI